MHVGGPVLEGRHGGCGPRGHESALSPLTGSRGPALVVDAQARSARDRGRRLRTPPRCRAVDSGAAAPRVIALENDEAWTRRMRIPMTALRYRSRDLVNAGRSRCSGTTSPLASEGSSHRGCNQADVDDILREVFTKRRRGAGQLRDDDQLLVARTGGQDLGSASQAPPAQLPPGPMTCSVRGAEPHACSYYPRVPTPPGWGAKGIGVLGVMCSGR